ncbi:hypothetical protein APY94_04565 [Thermococcus celericrescens]|uniref:KaiC-like domain-containing protein n=1 Tax=Thermococcus celericrescens TaxID=227598 RepID=A0A100XYC8_9EURY|nr:hypothetical protein [Thermococcus celericrescens]KUH33800.1 hypothetical protein APY94_04565 [Thermococcus celericrescens]
MEILSTGIPILDEALGGGLLEDSNLLITYDTYSRGWALGFEILRRRMEMGDFGVILDSVLPITPLRMKLGAINFNLNELGGKGDLAVIDIFSSFYSLKYSEGYVYTDLTIDVSTFLPKYNQLYRRVLRERIGDKRPVGIDVTVDGMAFLLGEKNFIRVFQRLMALKERARLFENRKRPLNIFLLNRCRASEELVSWMALYSQYLIEFQPTENPGVERMFVRTSPLPDFAPTAEGYVFRLVNGRVEIEKPGKV